MSTLIISFLVEAARGIITAAAVYSIVKALGMAAMRVRPTRYEWLEALGGFLWVVGVWLWRMLNPGDYYDMDLLFRSAGIALMLYPRLVYALTASRRDT